MLRRFNSTLVRLRLSYLLPEPLSVGQSFNSTLVRLRPRSSTARAIGNSGFNSTLVRLRPARRLESGRAFSVQFQFHSGSIKTARGNSEHLRQVNVSIPLWFD